ncbi:MAG: hypothetical protein FLDDKLPJ_02579 [Phycisphaerae bacterium]|nr:hypothetical protein [Phycisphaerae bacterium]
MSYDDDIFEIERAERELRRAWVDPPGPDVESVRRAVRVGELERWFAEVCAEAAPPLSLSARVKHRVRAALSEARRPVSVPAKALPRLLVLRRAGAIAAAAGFVLLMTAPLGRMIARTEDRPTTFGAFDALMASFSLPLDDQDRALHDVERELEALEDRVYALPPRDADDALLRSVDEELDELMHDLEADFDT